MKQLLGFVFALLIGGSAFAQRVEPLVNFPDQSIMTTTGKQLTSAEFKAAATRAAVAQRWEVVDGGDNRLVATLTVKGRHIAVVNIDFAQTTYSVTYRDSVDLNYAKSAEIVRDPSSPLNIRILPTDQYDIHPNYNKWVKNLVMGIRNELRRL